jgi:hypothetical protein
MKHFLLNSAVPFILLDEDNNRLRQLEPDSSKDMLSFLLFDTSVPKKARYMGRLKGGTNGICLKLPDDLRLTSMGKPYMPMADGSEVPEGIPCFPLMGAVAGS